MACASDDSSKQPAPIPVPKAEVFLKGLGHCESLSFDGVYFYVSDFGGELAPGKKDGNGKILQVDSTGKIIKDNIAPNVYLSAPKASIVIGGKIYVNDIDSLKVIDLSTGTLLSKECIDFRKDVRTVATIMQGNEVKVRGTESYPGVNDIVQGADSLTVFVSITNSGNIYRVNLATRKKVKIATVPYANGLAYRNGVLYAQGFTTGNTFTQIKNADTYPEVSPLEVQYITEGGLDGLAFLNDTTLIFSDWGKDYFTREGVQAIGKLKTLNIATGQVADLVYEGAPKQFKGPADILLVGKKLYVPALGEDKVYVLPLP